MRVLVQRSGLANVKVAGEVLCTGTAEKNRVVYCDCFYFGFTISNCDRVYNTLCVRNRRIC